MCRGLLVGSFTYCSNNRAVGQNDRTWTAVPASRASLSAAQAAYIIGRLSTVSPRDNEKKTHHQEITCCRTFGSNVMTCIESVLHACLYRGLCSLYLAKMYN
jgi:UDP-3-O-acyl-N-acetylglucosamine deacetylase